MKTMSILCLMMILRGGFANPVAGEGGSDSGLGLMAAVSDSFNPLLTFFVNDAMNDDSVDDAIEHGRWYSHDSVHKVGFKYNVQGNNTCCDECKKTYKDTEFFGQTYKSFPTHAATRDCTCIKSKPGFTAQTYALGFESGKCGLWNYTGDGDLGEGRIISGGVGILGVITDVSDASNCCQTCMAMEKFPATHLFDFSLKNKQCKCYTTKIDAVPVTSARDYSIGICSATEVTDAPAAVTDAPVAVTDASAAVTDASAEVTDAHAAVTDAPEIDDQIMNDTPNVTSKGEVSEPAVSVEEKSESEASADSGNVPDAAALTITTTTVKPEICDGSFVCCPLLIDGDNTAGSEKFISESEYEDTFSSCENACKILYPFSNGVTQSKTLTYKNGKPRCWCEFGQSVFHQSTGYQTCLFPVGEDDYDYE